MGKAIKSVAKIALPVIGTAVGGPLGGAIGGGLGGAIGGGGLKGAALGAIGGGLGGALLGGAPTPTGIGLFDSLNSSIYSGLSPLRSLGSNLMNSVSSSFGGSPLSSSSALSSGSRDLPWIKDVMAGKLMPNSSIDNYLNLGQQGSSGILSRLGNAISSPSLKDATSILSIIDALRGEESRGMLNQQEILNQMNADKAKQDQQSASFIASLNSSPLQRVQTNPSIDYYSYGTRPETKFFEKIEPEPIKFARGGKVPAIDAMKGQADTVHAKLSEGEYVIPADVVASLGDGNSMAGAKALDHMLKNVRKTKAPAMRKGVLPPKSKSPLAYLGKVA